MALAEIRNRERDCSHLTLNCHVLKTLFCPPGVGQHVIVKWVFPAQIPGFSVTKVKFYVTSIARPLLVPVTSPKNQTILSLYSVILYVRPQPRLQRVRPSLPEEGHGNGHMFHKRARAAGWEEKEYANSVRIDHCCRNQIVIQFDLRAGSICAETAIKAI
jgi:hypothetical protein